MEILENNKDQELALLIVTSDAVHDAKAIKASFANSWLFLDGWRNNLQVLLTLCQDFTSEIGKELRKFTTLESFRHIDRQSTSSVAYVGSTKAEEVLNTLRSTEKDLVIYMLLPDKFRKTQDNKMGILLSPSGICSDPNDASSIFITDLFRKMVYHLKLCYPAMLNEVK